MHYTTSDIDALLKEGEGETLEYKRDVSSSTLAKLIAAFANSRGGLILVGVDEDPRYYTLPIIVGVDKLRLEKIYQAALSKLSPQPQTAFSTVTIRGKEVGIVQVERDNRLILLDTGAIIRVGTSLSAMRASSIVHVLQRSNEQNQIEALAQAIERLTLNLESMQTKLETSRSFRSKFIDYVCGGIVGALISFLLTYYSKQAA